MFRRVFSFVAWWLFGRFRNTFKKKRNRQKNRTAGYIFGLLDSRTPKPNLSNRGTTLLLLMLQRGTKTWVTAPLALIRSRIMLAKERACFTSSTEELPPARSKA